MQELKCKNCGAPLRADGKCEYCGSVFRIDRSDGIERVVLVQEARWQTLRAEIYVPFESRQYMKPKDISNYSIHELTKSLAEGLTAFMKLDVTEDPIRMASIIRGTVRVIPPSQF